MNTHPLTDEYIAEFWPDVDSPDGREEIRRQFDALMAQVRNSSIRRFPRHPEAMAQVVVEKARQLPERLEIVKAALAGLPEHWRQWQWSADAKPAFGDRFVRSTIVGDNGHGFGRQWIACVNHVSKDYVGTLADFIAAANPDTVGMMVARIEQIEVESAAAPQEGIELAARFVEKRLHDYVSEHGVTDPDTGTVEYPGDGEEYVYELEEIIEGIRALCAQARPADENDTCPVCDAPLRPEDTCATDIELGICHAECLAGSPVVDLDTGEPCDGEVSTYTYGSTAAPAAQEQESAGGSPLLEWAVDQWKRQVGGRPLHNVHRRSLDDVWRQVIRWAGGDPISLIGPGHDELIAALPARGASQ